MPLISKSLNVNICSTVCKQPVAAKGTMSAVWQAGYAVGKKSKKHRTFAICVFPAAVAACFVRHHYPETLDFFETTLLTSLRQP